MKCLKIKKCLIISAFLFTMISLFGETVTAENAPTLEKNNWAPNVYKALNNLINENGVKSENYNPEKKPYAVFDWDNTSIINDVEENILFYQLQHLRFKLTPDQLNKIIRKDIPETDFAPEFSDKEGKKINIDLIAEDIVSDYSFLYQNYEGFKGTESLDEIKKTPQYEDFVVKMRFLYEAIGGTFSPDVSYPWVIYLFSGMNKKEVTQLANEAIDYSLNQPMTLKTYTSPEDLPGKAGVVSIKLYLGLRTEKEMQNLMYTLMANGIDVYICSASFVDVIKTVASEKKYGYNVPEDHVIAMELERDKDGVILPEYRKGYDQTQNTGKTKNINRFLVSKYGYGPILVGGDSGGDYPMLTDFKNTRIGLIINRCKSGNIGTLCQEAIKTDGSKDAKFILQGRDENKGTFIPTSKSIFVGTTEEKLTK